MTVVPVTEIQLERTRVSHSVLAQGLARRDALRGWADGGGDGQDQTRPEMSFRGCFVGQPHLKRWNGRHRTTCASCA